MKGIFRKTNYAPGELSTAGKVFTYAALALGLAFFLFPVLWMVFTSLKSLEQIVSEPLSLLPNNWNWSNYVEVFQNHPFGTYLWNTTWYTIVTVCGTVFFSAFIAFGFARFRARGKTFLFAIVLSTMMLPPQVTMIPQYLLFNKIGWVDSYLPLTVPMLAGSAFLIFLLRQFYMGLPKELDEAVTIDGGGYFTIFFRIILPLSFPAMATAAILEFMFRWNDLIGPLIYLNTQDLYPLSLGLANFTAAYAATPWQLLMAASVMAVIPPLVLFFLAQKYFIQGVVISGTKG
ncbi:carbohydrate ABC transporter permease [Shouchella clausii]|jgi:multiple sugar transport system permease protein|uniref:Sugar ABC transporter permease n=2 Tax=Shouchella TaxID=2893057 RepID=Q5WBF2_SHOC1|nr:MULTISPECIES: carbohydrate ABC transporter permease [Shouchella]ALA53257.1 sugar ABC transporter permease [Shouchella clausii]MBU3231208.1 carbohydrate ABC transporter permease [Shouchella clausii]MBU3263788.1 carbohydrate ABC transporter permease [Shouchella clausii]MBU3508250.1 carbohydrate ABC transporter permease [Shouchella clausii]MBU3534249.1 carbohydrate ABC transporter permease [Shouchella clausii]